MAALTWLFIIAVLLIAVLLLQRTRRNLPGQPPLITGLVPLLGPVLEFTRHPLNFARQLHRKHGDVFTVELMGKRLTFLVGPDAQAPFFQGSDEDLDQNEPYRFAVPIFGPGVVYDADLQTRTQQMKFMSKSLRAEQLKAHVPVFVRECEMFFDKWPDEGLVDLRKEFSQLIILTASRTLMGPEIREHLFQEVADLFEKLDQGLTTVSLFWPNAPIHKHRVRDAARMEMVRLFSKVIQNRRAKPEEKYDDVLQLLMDSEYRDGRGLTDEEITGMMIALLFAGQHTSTITSSWTVLFLLANRKYLPWLLEEQRQIEEAFGDNLCFDALQRMERLHWCIKEALRLRPPLIFLMRKTVVPLQIAGFNIPAGDTLFVSPVLSHEYKAVWTEPLKYDPERFAPGREEDKQKKFSFIGFGGGKHGCLGENFAYLQVKSIISVLLKKFDLELLGDLPEPDYKAMVVGALPHQVRIRRIKHN